MKPTSIIVPQLQTMDDAGVGGNADANELNIVKENDAKQNGLYNMKKLTETLNPLFLSLRCFGLAYGSAFKSSFSKLNLVEPEHESATDIEAQSRNGLRRQVKHKLNRGKCYSIFIAVLLWVQVFFSSKSVFTAGRYIDILSHSVPFGWMLFCACQQVIFTKSVTSWKNGDKLSRLGKFLKEMTLVKAGDVSDTKRQVKVIVIVSWLAVIANTIIVFIGLNNPNKNVRENLQHLIIGNWSKEALPIITYIYLPIHGILTGVWIFTTANYVSLCLLVANRFEDIFQRASADILLKKNLDLSSLRKEHVQLCHVVYALDDILSPSGLVCYAIYIPLTCISLNVCIVNYEKTSSIELVAYVFWIVSNVTILFISSVSGALVNHKAHRLSEVIYDISVNDLDSKSELELMLLISNLNSNSTGLTVGGLTTVTKGMILTVSYIKEVQKFPGSL